MKVGSVFAAVALGVIAGAAVHACCCANMTRDQQRNVCRNSRKMVRVAKQKMGM